MDTKMKSLVAAAALFCTVGARAETVDRSVDANAKGIVEISSVSGSVRVIAWDRAEVHVKGELGGKIERLELERRGDTTVVKVIYPSQVSGDGFSTVLDIQVPRDSSIKMNTVSASQVIEGVRGSQRLQTVSGDIQTQLLGEILQANSVSGRIVGRAIAGQSKLPARVRFTTVSGKLQLIDAIGELDLQSVSGNMDVNAQDLVRARFKTTSGDTTVSASVAAMDSLDAESVSGKFSFDLRGKLNAYFDIESFSAAISSCFGPKPERLREHGPGNALRFKEGEGHGQIRVRTLSGSIDLCKK